MTARTLWLGAVAAGLAATLLSGCSPAPALDAGVASKLAGAAQELRTEAATGRYADALAKLDSLEREARNASSNGTMSSDRSSQVLGAIASVRKDLQALASAQSAPTATLDPTPTPEPTRPKAKGKKTPDPTPPPEDN
ncbi:hypothetical protein [Sinomonas sp. P10A9]|uniref:Uncharacterized protein n=1 Tax=Sinomonas puerhi TaxID=3238584 RepID=A0AB39L3R2_9MICC